MRNPLREIEPAAIGLATGLLFAIGGAATACVSMFREVPIDADQQTYDHAMRVTEALDNVGWGAIAVGALATGVSTLAILRKNA